MLQLDDRYFHEVCGGAEFSNGLVTHHALRLQPYILLVQVVVTKIFLQVMSKTDTHHCITAAFSHRPVVGREISLEPHTGCLSCMCACV